MKIILEIRMTSKMRTTSKLKTTSKWRRPENEEDLKNANDRKNEKDLKSEYNLNKKIIPNIYKLGANHEAAGNPHILFLLVRVLGPMKHEGPIFLSTQNDLTQKFLVKINFRQEN